MITVELDPRHTLPPVKGVEYEQTLYQSLPDYEYVDSADISVDELDDSDYGANDGVGPLPPDSVTVLSQTTRMSNSGQIVVDVLIDILEVMGAEEYEVRLAVN